MSLMSKSATAGVLALSLAASSFGAAPASAHDHGLGLGLGLATGLIIGGILLNEHRHAHPAYIYDNTDYNYNVAPACYPGPLQWRWQQVCQPDGYGQLYCQNVKSYYRPEVCN